MHTAYVGYLHIRYAKSPPWRPDDLPRQQQWQEGRDQAVIKCLLTVELEGRMHRLRVLNTVSSSVIVSQPSKLPNILLI